MSEIFNIKKIKYAVLLALTISIIAVVITCPAYRKQMNAAMERINTQSRLLETKFGTMEYAIHGQGKPVLLIHGAGGGFDQGLWLGQTALEGGYQFIAPSKFGYLNSNTPKEFSAQLQAVQYKILLDYLGLEKVTIVAVSAGGPSAMQFASDYPDRVDKLILLSTVSMPPNPNDKAPFFIKIIQLIQRSDYAYWLFTKAFKSQILNLVGIPSGDYKKFTSKQKNLANELLEVMHPMSLRYDGTITDGLIIKNFDIPEDISIPTLIIHAKNDGLVHYSHAEYAHQNIKNSRLILYDHGGHGALSQLKDARKQIKTFLED